MKILALRPDRPQDRPQDFTDIRELLKVADAAELERARAAPVLISRRGYDRGKDLEGLFERHMADSSEQHFLYVCEPLGQPKPPNVANAHDKDRKYVLDAGEGKESPPPSRPRPGVSSEL